MNLNSPLLFYGLSHVLAIELWNNLLFIYFYIYLIKFILSNFKISFANFHKCLWMGNISITKLQ